MKEIAVFIVDDEERAISTLEKALTTFFEQVNIVGKAMNIDEAYKGISDTSPDLVFLDIEMGSESGFQLLEKFERVDFHIVFLTAHEEFALRAIKLSALDYIIKPATIGDLKSVLQKASQDRRPGGDEELKVRHMFGNFLTADKTEHKLTVSVSDGYEFISVGDIYYVRASGSYTDFHLKNGKKLTTSRNLKFFESILEGYGFFRIHNSTIINLKYIKKLNKTAGGSVIMENDEEFGISKSRKDEFMNLLALK